MGVGADQKETYLLEKETYHQLNSLNPTKFASKSHELWVYVLIKKKPIF